MTTDTSAPASASAPGSAPITSASPPALAHGVISAATIAIFMASTLDALVRTPDSAAVGLPTWQAMREGKIGRGWNGRASAGLCHPNRSFALAQHLVQMSGGVLRRYGIDVKPRADFEARNLGQGRCDLHVPVVVWALCL